MSAIAGIFNFNEQPIDPYHVNTVMKAFETFPADDVYTWCNNSIFLGCQNQWITPESVGVRIPYSDQERKLVITADAIIDNREELFDKLAIDKSERITISDSQLILLAYSKWEDEAPKQLIGDFAFMIWDERKRKLFGARDFSGSRTLYYFDDLNRVAFGTTIEPLLRLPFVKKELNEHWLAEFLAIPTMVEAVDMTLTVYKKIKQVPPCHSISIQHGKILIRKYQNIVPNKVLKFKSDEEYIEAFHEVFNTAVSNRLRTHGLVGSHLSGGLDSGTVVSFAANTLKEQGKKLHTFSYIPQNDFIDWTPKYYIPDERPFIKETVNYVGNIQEHYLDFEGRNPYFEINRFLNIMEMPYKFFENTFWLNGISESARDLGIKVMLNGARGNHSISWGSWNLTINNYSNLLKKFKWIRLFNELDKYCQNYNTGKSIVIPNITRDTFPKISNIYRQKYIGGYEFPRIINPTFAEKTNVFSKLKNWGIDISGGNIVHKLNYYRKTHYENLYPWNKSGVANTNFSLKYGVWDRDPTNDLRVIRFCLSLPEEQYVKGGMERSFIRRATKDILPDLVRLNFKSRGIQGADVIHRMSPCWDEFINELYNLSKDASISNFLDINVVKDALDNIKDNKRPDLIFNDHFKILSRSLILYRFLKSL